MAIQERFNEIYASLTTDGKLLHVQELLERAARKWPNNIMLLCQDRTITYKEVYDRSLLLAHQLRDLGVHKGDRAIILYENSIEFFIAYFAIWQAGGVVVPLNVFLIDHEVARIVEESEPKVIIVSPQLREKLNNCPPEYSEKIMEGVDSTSPITEAVSPVPLEEGNGDDLAALLYTSGTTGFPKGVMLSSYNIIINTIQGISQTTLSEKDRVFSALPLFHSFPQNVCVWSTTLLGGSAIIVPKITRRELFKGARKKPTVVIAVPALYGLMCMLRVKFKNIRYFLSGGDALSDKVRGYFELLYGRKICNGYGLTETSPFVSVDMEEFTKPTNTIGAPLPRVSYSIRDEEGKEVQHGEIGVLWLKGPNIMLGYYKAPEATAEVLQNGWFNTGDLAYISPADQIVLAGRARDLISNKGLKIYPQEVENILLSHPLVFQAGVIGVKKGEEELPVAYIATKEPNTVGLVTDLKKLCAQSLAAYKIPRQFYIRTELVVTATGKVDKKVLRAELEKESA